MRIRTIKPEFYRSETLAGVSREFRDLAKALISCADDEGYFASHPRLIAADCYPFDLDGPEFVTRGLEALSAIGFCELHDGNVGFLPTFKDNQRISHPQSSKLKTKKGERISVVAVLGEPVPQSFRTDSAVAPQSLHASSAVVPEDVYREQGTGNREEEQGTGSESGARVLQDLWNAETRPPLPRWQQMPDARRATANARWRDQPDRAHWTAVFARVQASRFLTGAEGKWTATPDWILKPSSLAKLLEGNFDNRAGPPPKNAPTNPDQQFPLGAL